MNYDDRIVTWAERGVHIPLRCKNHLELRWSTKNLAYIGARSIFFALGPKDPKGQECNCPGRDLEVLPLELAQEWQKQWSDWEKYPFQEESDLLLSEQVGKN